MQRILLFFVLGLIPLPFFLATNTEGTVVTLTELNWESLLNTESCWIIDFYAPWCGHCKRLAPVFEETAQLFQEEKIPVKLGKVDCTVESSLCNGIQGYPTLKYYKNGKLIRDYDGSRTKSAFLSFSKRISGPSVQVLGESNNFFQEIETLRKEAGSVFLIVGNNSLSFPEYERIANLFVETTFGVISASNRQNLEEFSLKEGNVVVFNDLTGKNPLVFSGEVNQLESWINIQRHPSFPSLNGNNFHSIVDSKLPLLIALLDSTPLSKQLNTNMKEIATNEMKNERKMIVSTIDAVEHAGFLTEVGVSQVPSVILLQHKDDLVFQYDQTDFSVSSIQQFVRDYQDGKIKATGTGGLLGTLRRNFYLIIIGGLLAIVAFAILIWNCVDDEPLPGYDKTGSAFSEQKTESLKAKEE